MDRRLAFNKLRWLGLMALLMCLTVTAVSGQSGIITTVAGDGTFGYSGDDGPATSASLFYPEGVAADASGNLFIADTNNHRIRKVSASGIITTFAGNGTAGFSGDGGPATSAEMFEPIGVAMDASGNLFIVDDDDNRIRKVSASGIITTVAGNGTAGFSGDGGPATSASLSYPTGVAMDASGNLFIADYGNNRIREVSASGIITTVVGDGTQGSSGDGGPATSASLYYPYAVAVSSSGLFIGEQFNSRIRKVSASGIITTVAGNGTPGFSGDGGPATSASLSGGYWGLALDVAGNLFIADYGNNRIRKVSASGIITTVAGNGTPGFSGDGGPATLASLWGPDGVAVNASGNLFIVDNRNDRIREVSASLTVSPANLSFSLIAGDSSTQQISLASPVAGLTWSATTLANWITLTPASGTAPGTITVAVNTASLQPGTYTSSITILNPLAAPSQETVGISLTVTAPGASISVAPATLSFQAQQGAPAQSQSLQIGGITGTAWQATATTSMGAWLTVSPGSGQVPASLTATVNTVSLGAGIYQGSITIQASGPKPSSSTIGVTLTVTTIAQPVPTLSTLYRFCSQTGCADGGNPSAGLFQATNGDFYGTTTDSGANGQGTVFKITPSGTLTTLYSFCPQGGVPCPDGYFPQAELIQATNGDFYGTTTDGGANCAPYGCGTVFKITPSGMLTTLYSFCSQSGCTDGWKPEAGLVQGTDGNFYGTTLLGGANCGANGCGTVFKITPSGILTTLYSFCSQSGCSDGATPEALIQGSNGDFYGTTLTGGAPSVLPLNENTCIGGCGTIFKVTPSGTLTTLYSFCPQGASCADGYNPMGLVQGTDGNLYGTTINGNANHGGGTVFKITPSGTLTTLYSFCSQFVAYGTCADGGPPESALVQGTDGNFYGTTLFTIFKITPSGMLTTLINFCPQGGCPYSAGLSALTQATNGDFYGTTSGGGIIASGCNSGAGCGTIFEMSVGLVPSITSGGIVPVDSTVNTIQPGEWVSIYGTNLASSTVTWNGNFPTSLGGTSVTINGKAAYLSFVSPAQINVQAPDATAIGSVPVVVTTMGGTATSTVTLAQFAPSFLLLDSEHVAGIILRSDGSGAYGGGTYDIIGPTGNSLGYATVAAKPGDVLEIFGTGFGPTGPAVAAGQAFSGSAPTANPVTLHINDISVTPSFAGLTGAGLYQINLTVPAGLGTGDVSLQASVGGVQTPSGVVISLQ
jgi:uncharacterized protein (TIGR03437 family)